MRYAIATREDEAIPAGSDDNRQSARERHLDGKMRTRTRAMREDCSSLRDDLDHPSCSTRKERPEGGSIGFPFENEPLNLLDDILDEYCVLENALMSGENLSAACNILGCLGCRVTCRRTCPEISPSHTHNPARL